MEDIFFSKLIKDGGKNTEMKTLLYIKSKWSEMALEMIIYSSDTNESFKGELSTNQMSRVAAELDTSFEQFYVECKDAITANVVAGGYLYRLENEFFKLVKKDPFEIDLLEVPIKKLTTPLQILDNAFEEISKLKEKKEAEESLIQHEEISTQETLETLRNCLKEKEQTEKVLLRKFLMLLNAKKEEIRKLKDQLEAGENHNRQRSETPDEQVADDYDADTQPFAIEAMEN